MAGGVKRGLWRIARIGRWALLCVVLVLGLLLAVLHTGWGRGFAKDKIAALASDAIPGSLAIAGLEGSLLGEPRLEGIVVRSPDKAEVLRIRSLVLGLSLSDLVSRTINIDKLTIDGLHLNLVQAADGTLNLIESLIDPNAKETEPWAVQIDGLSLTRSSVDFRDKSGVLTQITNLSLANLKVHSTAVATRISIDKLQMDFPMCKEQRVSLSGEVEITEAGFASKRLRVDVGSSFIELKNLSMASDLSEGKATLDGELQPALLRCLQPESTWLAPIAFHGSASKNEADKDFAFALGLAGKKLEISDGRVSPDFASIGATLHLRQFAPGKYLSLGPEIQGTGVFQMRIDRKATGGLVATFAGDGSATVDDFEVQLDTLVLKNQGTLASLALVLRGYQGSAGIRAHLDWGQEPMVLSEGRFEANIPKLSALPVTVPLAGGLAIGETSFAGPITNLEVKGHIDGVALRHEDARVQRLRARFAFHNLPSSLAGSAALDANGVRHGPEYIGRVSASVDSDAQGRVFQLKLNAGHAKRLAASLDAELVSEFGRHELTLRTLQVQHRSLRATLRRRPARPAKVTLWPGGNLTVDDLLLSLGDGALAIDGSFESGLRATLRGISLAPLLALVPDFYMPLTATLSGEATAQTSGQGLVASVSLASDDLKLTPKSDPIRIELDGKMQPTLLAANLKIDSESNGSVTLAASLRPPRGKWARTITKELRSAQVEFTSFRLRLLRPLHPELASLDGVLEGSIKLGAGMNKVEGEVNANKLVHARWNTTRSARVTIDADRENVALDLSLSDSKIGAGRVSLNLRPPGPLHSPWLWKPSLDGVFRDSDLVIDTIDLVALRRALPELDTAGLLRSGKLSGSMALRNAGKSLALKLVADSIRVAEMPGLSGTLEASADHNSTRMAWKAMVDKSNELEGEATLAVGLALLRDRNHLDRLLERIKEAKVDAKARVITNSPALWSKLAGSENRLPLAGQARADATFLGSLLKPSGTVLLSISDAKVDGIALAQVTLNASLFGDEATAQVSIAQSRTRRLEAEVVLDVKKRNLRRGAIDAQDIDLRLLRALDKTGEGILSSVAGVANGKFEVTGNWDAPEPVGLLRIRNGEINLGGSLLPIVGLSIVISAKDKLFKMEGKAESGSGRIKISGQSKVQAGGLEDISIRLRTTKVPVVVASLVCSVDVDSHSQLVIKPGLFDIKTKIDSALIRVPIRSFLAETRSLHSLEGMSDLVYISETPEEQDLDIDQSGGLVRLRILANDNVQVRTKVMQAKLSLDIDTTFVDNKVIINGSANVTSGHVDLFERRYLIEKASANFRGRVPVNPSFDLRLRHDFDQLSLTILGRGDVDDPKITFVADPPDYDQATLLAIVLGQAPAQNENQQGLRDNALSALSTYAANKVQEVLAPILPFDLDVVRVENTDNDGYLYVGGKWITDDWFVAYHYRTLADELENTNEAESKYRLSKSWALEGVAGESEAGLDILWTKRWGK